ncbi:MAG: hypothetical protein MZW92_30005 [Comamonadaceae bacterium]|nr:hypothetical protein [Comamonadaceae bacterium]
MVALVALLAMRPRRRLADGRSRPQRPLAGDGDRGRQRGGRRRPAPRAGPGARRRARRGAARAARRCPGCAPTWSASSAPSATTRRRSPPPAARSPRATST